jgi:hypothetical protein
VTVYSVLRTDQSSKGWMALIDTCCFTVRSIDLQSMFATCRKVKRPCGWAVGRLQYGVLKLMMTTTKACRCTLCPGTGVGDATISTPRRPPLTPNRRRASGGWWMVERSSASYDSRFKIADGVRRDGKKGNMTPPRSIARWVVGRRSS